MCVELNDVNINANSNSRIADAWFKLSINTFVLNVSWLSQLGARQLLQRYVESAPTTYRGAANSAAKIGR